MTNEFPEFRRAYVKLPWPILYETPASNGNIIVERDYRGEPCLFSITVKDPSAYRLDALSQLIQHASTAPIEDIKQFRRMLQIASLPLPLRRLIWWVGLNFGRQRANYYGTFGLSVYSALNAESLHPLSPLTTLLNYGVIDASGEVNVRIIYDHRVMNGATVARALGRLEEILNSAIVDELKTLAEAAPVQQRPEL